MAPMSAAPHVLLVDDDPHDRGLAAAVLAQGIAGVRISEAGDAAALAAAMRRGDLDVVVTELRLGWMSGLEALREAWTARPGTAAVVLAKAPTLDEAVAALRAGADDVLIKSSAGYLRLPAAVREARERTAHGREVARAELRLQSLLDRAGIGVFRSTLDQRLLEANAAFLRLLGVSSLEQTLRLDLSQLYFPESGRQGLLQRLDARGELHARQVELRRADGAAIWLNVTERLLLDAEGEVVIEGLVEEVSDLKREERRLQARLTELERSNADLREFAYVASHELQEPLRLAERYAVLLAEDLHTRLEVRERESLAGVLDSTRRMQALIDDLLALSRIASEGRPFETCDTNALFDRAARSLAGTIEATRAEVRRDDLPVVRCDGSQLLQLFHNLLANALKFRRGEPPRIHASAERQAGGWRFAVRDNGMGIEAGQEDTIFGMFKRLHPELPGTGMGLAICKRIVERHGGRMWVTSEPGQGSTFWFELPAMEGERLATETAVTAAPKAAQ